MKKTVLLLLFSFTVILVQAQTSSGNMMVGGTLSLYSSAYPDSNNDYTSTTFSPSFGYFISDNLAIGGIIAISSDKNESGAGTTKNSSFAVGPFVRYYKFTSNESFAFYGQARFLYGSGKTDNGTVDSKSSSIEFGISPGFTYFFNKHWALDFGIRGFVFESRDPNKDVDNDKNNRITFDVSSFSPDLGFRYHFGN